MRLYNTLNKSLEEFVPLDPDGRVVTFYTCGPTVYDYAHIGNFRSFLNADLLRRSLELVGYEVRHVMNMTDVGHMTEDDAADGEGEDKMAVAGRRLLEAKKAGTLPPGVEIDPADPYAVADFYVGAFLADARRLGLLVAREAETRAELMPRPTRYVEQMIRLVEKLIEKGNAYVAADGVVYFDVRSFPDYGRLSGNTIDTLREAAGGRVSSETQAVKKHPADFMLFKPDPSHIMRWPSPWGDGYPGWHLECSVMAQDLLGRDTNGMIDLHSGGEDNIFPHHECEIAQSVAGSGETHFARYWFHTRLLMVEGGKMSKSLGNFYTLGDLLRRGASPAAIRLALTNTHYRDNSNFTFQGLRDAQRQIDKWTRLETWLEDHRPPADIGTPLADAIEPFTAALTNDLNISGALGALETACNRYPKLENGSDDGSAGSGELEALRTMLRTIGVLELDRAVATEEAGVDAAEIESRIEKRNAARAARDFSTADSIRDELAAMGIEIKDGADGTTWRPMVQ